MMKALATVALASVAAIPLFLSGGAWAQNTPAVATINSEAAGKPGDNNRSDWKRHAPDGYERHGPRHGEGRHKEGRDGRHGEGRYESRHGKVHHMQARGPRVAAALADRLSNLELMLGIKTAQLDAWRDYTSALLAMVQPPARPASNGSGNQQPSNDMNAQSEARLPGERMAGRAIDRADKARAVQQAATGLRAVLTPDQVEKLAGLDRQMMRRGPDGRDGGPRGPGRHHGNRPDMQRPAPTVDNGRDMTAPEDRGQSQTNQ